MGVIAWGLGLLLIGRAALGQESADQAEETAGDTGQTGEGGDSEGTEAPAEPAPGEPTIDLSGAREAPALTEAQHDFLKPRRGELPQNPYAQTDFTAYSLEWGEFKIGLASITAGVLPRIQLGTVPALWVLNTPNVNAKFNALRLGPVDMAVTAQGGQFRLGNEFSITRWEAGALASIIVLDPWSIHASASYGGLAISGEPDLSRISWLFQALNDTAYDEYYELLLQELNANSVSFDLDSTTVSGRLATDIRFNRRDSLIFQGSGVLWRDYDLGYTINGESEVLELDPADVPPIFGLPEFFTKGRGLGPSIAATYNVSASWQFAWKHVDLRLGLGWSAIQPQWLLQAVELDYRFGGKTRVEERRIRKYWRKDRKNIDKPDEEAPRER